MKNLDLEKLIILLSLVLLPAAGIWIYLLQKEIDASERAFQTCDAAITRVHGLHDLITKTNNLFNKGSESADDAPTYFQNRAMASQKNAGAILKREHITVSQSTPTKVRRQGGRGKIIGEDIEVKIKIDRGERGGTPLPRDFINAFIVNSESLLPIWKLRQLKMENKDFRGLRSGFGPESLETSDEWIVSTLVFARRRSLEAK